MRPLPSRRKWWPLLVLGLWVSASANGSTSPTPFVVIVNAEANVTSVDRQFLEDAFLKRVTQWPGDGHLRPVDQAARAPVRVQFSREVLERSVEEVRNYWQQRIFSGRDVPPVELEGDEQVVSYVAAHPGAVGYVSPGTDLKGAKSVSVR